MRPLETKRALRAWGRGDYARFRYLSTRTMTRHLARAEGPRPNARELCYCPDCLTIRYRAAEVRQHRALSLGLRLHLAARLAAGLPPAIRHLPAQGLLTTELDPRVTTLLLADGAETERDLMEAIEQVCARVLGRRAEGEATR